MKSILYLLFTIFPLWLFSQGQLWGVAGNIRPYLFDEGYIFHTTTEGEQLQAEYFFKTGLGGYRPTSIIMESSNILLGTTKGGGSYGQGVIFRFNLSNNTYTPLVDFDGLNGAGGSIELVLATNGKYYGSTPRGGVNSSGNLFEFDPSNDSISRIIGFWGPNTNGVSSPLMVVDSMIYGFTSYGGATNKGVLFKVNVFTKAYTKIFDFSSSFGSFPFGKLVKSNSGLIYGICGSGGLNNTGVIFKFDPNTGSISSDYTFPSQANIKNPLGDLAITSTGMIISAVLDTSVYKLFQYDPISKQCSILKNLPSHSNEKVKYFFEETAPNILGIVEQYPYERGNYYQEYDINQDSIINIYSDSSVNRSLINRAPIKVDSQYVFTCDIGASGDKGSIFKTNNIQDSVVVLKTFTDSLPIMPQGNLLYHSSGRFIGASTRGGVHDNDSNSGVIYSYDPISKKLKPLINFPIYVNGNQLISFPTGNLVELASGNILGTTQIWNGIIGQAAIFEYNFASKSTTVRKHFETTSTLWYNSVSLTSIGNDHFLGTLYGSPSMPNGAVFMYDYLQDTIEYIHVFNGGTDGKTPRGNIVEINPGEYVGIATGCIYKYNVNTSSYISVSTMGTDAENINPRIAVDANKYIYGICDDGYKAHIVRLTSQLDSIEIVNVFDTVPGLSFSHIGHGFNYSNNGL